MARLGGMSTESFSSARERLSTASVGLGSILREQKAMPGANRINVLLGLSSQSSAPSTSRSLLNSPAHSLSSSPTEPNGFLDVDDAELKDEDFWGMDMNDTSTYSLDPLHRQRLSHAYELGSTHTHAITLNSYHSFYGATHSHSQKHGIARPPPPRDASKQHMNMGRDGNVHSAQYQHVIDKSLGLTGAISASAGPVRLSPLSKLSHESHFYYSDAHQGLTPSRSIPQVEKRTVHDSSLQVGHQSRSAPVNVSDWSKIRRKDASAGNFTSIDEIGEDDDVNERLPPHVMLAKEYARDRRMTSSVCEGQGRTLKGRDMRRVRNAVWQQTGFAAD